MPIINKTLPPELILELQFLEDRFFTFDKPIPFKDGLMLYPVMVENYNDFMICSECFTLNKNDTTEGIMMTHLGYLIAQMEDPKEGKRWVSHFFRLIEMIFHVKSGIRCTQCGEVISYEEYLKKVEKGEEAIVCDKCGGASFEESIHIATVKKTQKEIVINGIHITSKEFNRLRQIVMYQNLPDYKDDSAVNKEIRDDQKLKEQLLAKTHKDASASLEDKMVGVVALTAYKLEDVYKLTMRKFIKILSMVDGILTYQAQSTGAYSGLVKFKELPHWLYKPQKGIYDTAASASEYTSKINSAGKA